MFDVRISRDTAYGLNSHNAIVWVLQIKHIKHLFFWFLFGLYCYPNFISLLLEPSLIKISSCLFSLFCLAVLHLLCFGELDSAPYLCLFLPEQNCPIWSNSQLMVFLGGNEVEEFLSSEWIWLVADINQVFLKVVMNLLCFFFLDLNSHCFAAEFKVAVEWIIALLYFYTLQVTLQLFNRTHLFCFNMLA